MSDEKKGEQQDIALKPDQRSQSKTTEAKAEHTIVAMR
jgi:hypothetical protein